MLELSIRQQGPRQPLLVPNNEESMVILATRLCSDAHSYTLLIMFFTLTSQDLLHFIGGRICAPVTGEMQRVEGPKMDLNSSGGAGTLKFTNLFIHRLALLCF